MGRFSASGARLHELRWPKPANAALGQGRPPQSHSSSLGPEHPQRAIRPARREKPTLGRYRAARGNAPRLLPLEPHRPHARSSAAGLSPGTRRVPGILELLHFVRQFGEGLRNRPRKARQWRIPTIPGSSRRSSGGRSRSPASQASPGAS